MDKELFDDLITACNEVIEHQKGNIKLRSTVVTIPDEEIEAIDRFNRLSEKNKRKAMIFINELYQQKEA